MLSTVVNTVVIKIRNQLFCDETPVKPLAPITHTRAIDVSA